MATDAEMLGERIAEQAAHLDAATHRLLTDLRAFHASGEWYRQGARSTAHWLSWRLGWGGNKAREHVRVARRLGELPRMDEALRLGELSYCKVRAMTRVATSANEAELVEQARHATGADLEKLCRKYATVVRAAGERNERDERARRTVWRRDLEDGMVKIEATLHAEEAAIVWAALEKVARERCARPEPDARGQTAAAVVIERAGAASGEPRDHEEPPSGRADERARTVDGDTGDQPSAQIAQTGQTNPTAQRTRAAFDRADALLVIAQQVLRGTSPDRAPTELVVTVSAETLLQPLMAPDPIGAIADGTCVSAETARRLACDCGVVYMAEDGAGAVLSVGRKTRSIPVSIKRALLRRDRTCRFPGCDNRLFLEGHHIEHWANGGETSLKNLVGMCSHHHRFVHEYGYQIVTDEAGQPVFLDPQGRPVRDVPPRPAPPDLGWRAIEAANEPLGITPRTGECLWDGRFVNYGSAIDELVRLDGLT